MSRALSHTAILCILFPIVHAFESYGNWSRTNGTTEYNAAPDCARSCLTQVALKADPPCWSNGCMCSEQDLTGANLRAGMAFVQDCARSQCAQSADAAANATLTAFQALCGLSPFAINVSTTASRSTALQSALPTATPAAESFNESTAVLIDMPDSDYSALNRCTRWVVNNCKSPKDNSNNCGSPHDQDYSSEWRGSGVHLRCASAECVCRTEKFILAFDKYFDRADFYCKVGFVYGKDNSTNPELTKVLTLLPAFCSKKGFSLEKWIIDLIGWGKAKGWTLETIVAVALAALSALMAILTFIWGRLDARKLKKEKAEEERRYGVLLEVVKKKSKASNIPTANGAVVENSSSRSNGTRYA